MQIVVRSLGVWAGTISLIGVNEEPPAMPVGSFFHIKKLYFFTKNVLNYHSLLHLITFHKTIKKDACNLGKNVPKWKGFKSVRMGRAKLSTKGENL